MGTTNLTQLKNYSEPEVLRLIDIIENKGYCSICVQDEECPLGSYCRTIGEPHLNDHKRIKVKMARDRLVFKSTTLKKIIKERRKQWDEYQRNNG